MEKEMKLEIRFRGCSADSLASSSRQDFGAGATTKVSPALAEILNPDESAYEPQPRCSVMDSADSLASSSRQDFGTGAGAKPSPDEFGGTFLPHGFDEIEESDILKVAGKKE